MASIKITCVNYTGSGRQEQHISSVGTSNGTFSVAQVVDKMKMGDDFYVLDSVDGKKVPVEATQRLDFPHLYIHTLKDGVERNNLLSLPECGNGSVR